MDRFSLLVARFQKLAEKTGRSKDSSYYVNVYVTIDGGWSFGLGCYDIGDLPRNYKSGCYQTFDMMLMALETMIETCENIVVEEANEI